MLSSPRVAVAAGEGDLAGVTDTACGSEDGLVGSVAGFSPGRPHCTPTVRQEALRASPSQRALRASSAAVTGRAEAQKVGAQPLRSWTQARAAPAAPAWPDVTRPPADVGVLEGE